MPRDNAHVRFLRDPDPEARRAELAAFVGPNAEPFLKMYDRLRERPEKPAFRAMTSFVVMAFFLGPCWFFYRRMWGWAWALVAVMVALAFIPGSSRAGFPLAIALSMFGRYSHLSRAFSVIERLRGGAAVADPDELRRAGGVSRAAGWTSSAVYLVLAAIGIAAAVLFITGGGDPDALR